MARFPPMPYTSAVAREATRASAVKKIRLAIAIRTPMSRTRPARDEKPADSSVGRPKSFTSNAPEILKRSVIWDAMSAFNCICSRVIDCKVRPMYRAGIRKTGSSTNDATVICHDRAIIAVTTNNKVMKLPITPDSVEVKACCAPITSLFNLETRAPVCVLVKKATGIC